jgi:hypothetical protein
LAGTQNHADSIQAAADGGDDRRSTEPLDCIGGCVRPQHLVD